MLHIGYILLGEITEKKLYVSYEGEGADGKLKRRSYKYMFRYRLLSIFHLKALLLGMFVFIVLATKVPTVDAGDDAFIHTRSRYLYYVFE